MEQFTLANGLRVILVPMQGLESVTVLTMVGVGSRFESSDKLGISHFLEHLPFKGTENYPTSMAIASAVDGVGGKHNAMTSKDYTGYWVKVAAGHLDLALDVVSDLLLTPKLRSEDIEKERGVILEEINMYEDEPQAKVASLFDNIVYSGSPLSMDTVGNKDTVSALQQADFLHHYQSWYNPENVVIGVVGKMTDDRAQITEKLEKYFSKGEPRTGGGQKEFGVPVQTEPRVKVFYKETEQAHFHLGYRGIGWEDERRYVMGVMTTILGGNSSSWLFNEIREKRGLAYYAYAGVDNYREIGSLDAFEGVNLSKIDEAIKVTLEQFGKMAEGKVMDEEVVKAKEYLTGKLALDLEDSSSMANLMVKRLVVEGRVEPVKTILERVKKVTTEKIRRLAREVMVSKGLNLAIIGPYKDEGRFKALLGV